MSCTIRPYAPEDRRAVRRVCCETGFMGDPIDPVFSDRDTFADFFTRYYTDFEPQNCMIAEAQEGVVGYLTGCVNYRRYPWAQAWVFARALPRIVARACRGTYRRSDYAFMQWFLTRSVHETPNVPPRAAHFHINLLPDWRASGVARRMIFPFVNSLKRRNVKRVYGQIQTYDDRRSTRLFERYGFKLFDRRRLSRFERFGRDGVYVSTFVRETDVETTA